MYYKFLFFDRPPFVVESDLQKSFDLAIDENILVLEEVEVALQGPLAPERFKPQFGAIADHILDDDSLQLERAALQSGVHQHKPQRHDLAAPIEVSRHNRQVSVLAKERQLPIQNGASP